MRHEPAVQGFGNSTEPAALQFEISEESRPTFATGNQVLIPASIGVRVQQSDYDGGLPLQGFAPLMGSKGFGFGSDAILSQESLLKPQSSI